MPSLPISQRSSELVSQRVSSTCWHSLQQKSIKLTYQTLSPTSTSITLHCSSVTVLHTLPCCTLQLSPFTSPHFSTHSGSEKQSSDILVVALTRVQVVVLMVVGSRVMKMRRNLALYLSICFIVSKVATEVFTYCGPCPWCNLILV